MNQIKCITFDRAVQDALPEHIKAKMKADRQKQNERHIRSCAITSSINLAPIFPIVQRRENVMKIVNT